MKLLSVPLAPHRKRDSRESPASELVLSLASLATFPGRGAVGHVGQAWLSQLFARFDVGQALVAHARPRLVRQPGLAFSDEEVAPASRHPLSNSTLLAF